MSAPDEIAGTAPAYDEKRTNEKQAAEVEYQTAEHGDVFHDRTISVKDWSSRTFTDVPGQIKDYLISLFPIATWIYRYNPTWFVGDVCFTASTVPGRNANCCPGDCRFDRRRRCRAPIYILCDSGVLDCRVRVVLEFHGCVCLLFLCHQQRCYHRCE